MIQTPDRRSAMQPLRCLICLLFLVVGCGGEAERANRPGPQSGPTQDQAGDATASTGSPTVSGTRPSIVLVSIDTLRSDRLPAYSGDAAGVQTPNIDRLVQDGVLFERAYTHAPLTLPAHASLFTGLLPPQHGVRDNLGYRLGSSMATLAETLQAAGYRTGAAVSAYVLRRHGGLDRGFEHYDDEIAERPRAGLGGLQRDGNQTLERALAWIDSLGGERTAEPFFLFLHLFEPHTPYLPPEPFRSRYGNTYEGEVAAADAVLGRLLDELQRRGLYEDSAIVLVSDHGEGLGDHGEAEHGLLLYREVLQVPLILKLPSGSEQATTGRRVPETAQLIDLMPTLLELAILPARPELPGRSLLRAAPEEARAVYAETFFPRLHFGWSDLSALIEGPWHYIHGPDPELYQLLEDPAQRNNLRDGERRQAARLRQTLQTMQGEVQMPGEVSQEERERLAALGYLGQVGGESEGPLADPKTQLGALENLKAGLQAYQEGRFADAVARYRQAVREHPRSVEAWDFYGRSLAATGQRAEAADALRQALALAPGSPHLAIPAAMLLLELQRAEEALQLVRSETPRNPGHSQLRLLEGRILLLLGRVEEALELARELVRQQPENADAVYLRGSLSIGVGDLGSAEADLRRALELAPQHTAALSDLALLRQHQGDLEEARQLLERALALRPEDPQIQNNLQRLRAAAQNDGGGAG